MKNILGEVFGSWVVLRKLQKNTSGNMMWECRCLCGNIHEVSGSDLRIGRSTRCVTCRSGDFKKEIRLTDHRLYSVWVGMNRRCRSIKNKDYKHYGGRGIEVCESWSGKQGFVNFIKDMQPSFIEGLTLDRKNNDGDYTPDNCKWSTHTEQANNKNRK